MFSLIKEFFSILFTRTKKNSELKKPLIITCPRLEEEVLVKAHLLNNDELYVEFSYVAKEMAENSRYILSDEEMARCEEIVRVSTGYIMTIGPNPDVEDEGRLILLMFDHLRLVDLNVPILKGDTVEIQPIDIDFTQYPAVKMALFDSAATGEAVIQYKGSYHIIMNEEKTMMRICFQERPDEGHETFALGDKMLILLRKEGTNNLVEFIIGGITEDIVLPLQKT